MKTRTNIPINDRLEVKLEDIFEILQKPNTQYRLSYNGHFLTIRGRTCWANKGTAKKALWTVVHMDINEECKGWLTLDTDDFKASKLYFNGLFERGVIELIPM